MLNDLEKSLGYVFTHQQLLEEAVTHQSYAEENPPAVSYDRLEFLGDAVLDLIIADRAVQHLPEKNEGHLSKLRSSLVAGKSLSKKAKSIGLGKHLRLGNGEETTGGRQKDNILEDALEASIGAIYRDGGFEAAKLVVMRLFDEELTALLRGDFKLALNAKGELQERLQKTGLAVPVYVTIKETGPDHNKTFEVAASWNNREIGRGEGSSKKVAEQQAAQDALANPDRFQA